jgi:hypothetical protein
MSGSLLGKISSQSSLTFGAPSASTEHSVTEVPPGFMPPTGKAERFVAIPRGPGAVLPGVGRTKIMRVPTIRTAVKRFISTPFLVRTPASSVGSPAAHAGI